MFIRLTQFHQHDEEVPIVINSNYIATIRPNRTDKNSCEIKLITGEVINIVEGYKVIEDMLEINPF